MTKFIIDQAEPGYKQTVVKLFLRETPNGGIALKAREEDGKEWFLITVEADGTLTRASYVPEQLGFKLEDEGYIVIEDE